MQYKINAPQKIGPNSINLPASKSISNRAIILNKLSNSPFEIQNISNCDDTVVMLNAFDTENNIIDVKAAGTSMRFLTAYFAQTPGEVIITGTERMKQRPIHILVNALIALGGKIEYLEKAGFPPLKITGCALNGGEIFLSGGISSQFISALLMIAPVMEKGLIIHLEGEVISVPYIKLTLKMMSEYGVKATWENNTITIYPQTYLPKSFTVESDWSAASYWYEIAALSSESEIRLTGLFKDSAQGDSKVAELFLDLGIDTIFENDAVILKKTNRITKKYFHNFVNEPDLAQTFVTTCCLLGVPFLFTGLQSLKIKETDRIEALKNEMKKLGYILRDSNNSVLEWTGEICEPEANAVIETYEDHRMAMAFAPIAIKTGHIEIVHPGVVSKSYPMFWDDLKKVGFDINEKE